MEIDSPLNFIPFLISGILGWLAFNSFVPPLPALGFLPRFCLAGGLGLGISAHLTFLGFIFFNRLHPFFTTLCHLAIIAVLSAASSIRRQKQPFKKNHPLFSWTGLSPLSLFFAALYAAAFIPWWLQANFYPHGGWDAWSVWNLKAKFLYLGGEDWQKMFDPILWRASPHYPLLLPLINVWGWIWTAETNNHIPMYTAMLFGILLTGLLAGGLKGLTRSWTGSLAGLVLVTSPPFVTQVISQYSDLLFGYYLLAALYCFILARSEGEPSLAFCSGLFAGLLGFTKPEGFLAALIMLGIILFLKNPSGDQRKTKKYFCAGAAITLAPCVYFSIVYTPANITFINGLTSSTHPTDFDRLKTVFLFYGKEFLHPKWNGLWLALLAGIFLSGRRSVQASIRIIPAFLILYGLAVTFYYGLNTYFEIRWWLQVTLDRVLFSILPAAMFWAARILGEKDASGETKMRTTAGGRFS